tara:strand:- start:157 stop:825 length:669 start_codon:yes stop_codon:yes gene_type:complete
MIAAINEGVSDIFGFLGIAVGSLSGIVIAFINSKRNKEKNKKPSKISDLKDHDIFNTLKRTQYEVRSMKFYTDKKFDRVKTAMCYDFTKYKVKHCGLLMLEVAETTGIDKMNKDKLKTFIIENQMQMHTNYIKEVRKHWASKDINEKDIDYVLRLFDSFRYDVIKSFDHRITSIFGASYYDTNFSILLAVFDMWAMGIDLLPRDMQTTFESLNGKFKNLNYN